MYFTSYNHKLVGAECRDGGLQTNNPVQIAANESKKIWGDKTKVDLLLSIGSGHSQRASPPPSTTKIIPDWVMPLFQNLMDNLNGEKIWQQFMANVNQPLRNRCRRLTMEFQSFTEPALDDVTKMDLMQSEAALYAFPTTATSHERGSPTISDGIKEVAHCVLASLFFYELVSVSKSNNEVHVVSGNICCRLDSNSHALRVLLARVRGFRQKNTEIKIPATVHDGVREEGKPFELKHTFSQLIGDETDEIQVDVIFMNDIIMPISGFPASLKVSIDICWHLLYQDRTSLRSG